MALIFPITYVQSLTNTALVHKIPEPSFAAPGAISFDSLVSTFLDQFHFRDFNFYDTKRQK